MKSKKVIVGIFLVGGVVVFAVGLFLIGNHNQVFGSHFDVYTEFDKVDTLQSGAKLRVSGMAAGEVSDIEIPKRPSGKFRLKLHIDSKFRGIVREDSLASIETSGMVGNKYVNVAEGSSQSPECKGCTLPSQEPVDIGELIGEAKGLLGNAQTTITDLRQRVNGALKNITSASGHADRMIVGMTGNVERIAANGAHITNGVKDIVSDVRQGHGAVGELLTDDTLAKNVSTTIAQAKKTSANLEQASSKADALVSDIQKEKLPEEAHRTLANTEDITQQLKGAVGDFLSGGPGSQDTAAALRETIHEASRATRNFASDTEAVKHNFFLRGFFHRRGYYNLTRLNPSEYGSTKFVKHAKKRIWLSAGNLFTTSPAGAQQLTKEGQTALDIAMSQLVSYLPNNPIMIEGYSEAGTPAQRYLASQQRADQVEQYLESHFHLKPELIGTIPLGDRPPEHAGQNSWNGVCLALVVSHD